MLPSNQVTFLELLKMVPGLAILLQNGNASAKGPI
jgi:hypothetical protein